MLKVEITDDFMYNLFARVEANDDDIIGYGSERISIVYNDFLIVKLSLWTEITNYGKDDIEKMNQYHKNATVFEKYNRKFYIFGEKQTKIELEIISMLPDYLARRYSAEIVMFGEWRGHYITFCKRLIPVETDNWDGITMDEQRVLADVDEMLCQMENDLKDYPIKITDIHAGNFGYDTNGEVKFLDLGYWKRSESNALIIDWDDFFSWKNGGNYDSYYSDNSNNYFEDDI